jgi:LmbE family N-acetylglucosaminyl deacetylase
MIYWSLTLVIPFMWLAGALWVTDFAVPSREVGALRCVLAVFPHADDEAVTCAGFLHRLAQRGCAVTLVILTRGERGTPDATLDAGLGAVRAREAQAVAAILGIGKLIQAGFGDGTLCEHKPELAAFIAGAIAEAPPDLLLTYDRAGLYGHADHIACSEVVTELRATCLPAVPLWYVTLPRCLLARVKLPEHMRATTPRPPQALPTHKIFIGASVIPKIRAWYRYKSQRAALTRGIGKLLPIWFALSMMLFEYFAEVR